MTKKSDGRDENESTEPGQASARDKLETLRREVLLGWNQARNGRFSNRTVEEIAAEVAKSTK